MSEFALHPQLAADSFRFRELELCSVRVMDNKTVPWLLLVPRVGAARELIDLDAAAQQQLMREIAWSLQALRSAFNPDKLNVAALGNVVPQLHVHVVARFRTDPAWPRPVWGNLLPAPLSEVERREFCERLDRHWPVIE